MVSWIIALSALAIWAAATLLYLRRHIARALDERRKRREVQAQLRAKQATKG